VRKKAKGSWNIFLYWGGGNHVAVGGVILRGGGRKGTLISGIKNKVGKVRSTQAKFGKTPDGS